VTGTFFTLRKGSQERGLHLLGWLWRWDEAPTPSVAGGDVTFAERKRHPTSDASIERDDQRRHHGHAFLMRTHTDDGDYWFHHVAAIAGLND
jgi:hypothetical protein